MASGSVRQSRVPRPKLNCSLSLRASGSGKTVSRSRCFTLYTLEWCSVRHEPGLLGPSGVRVCQGALFTVKS